MTFQTGATVHIVKGTYQGLFGKVKQESPEQLHVQLHNGNVVRIHQSSVTVPPGVAGGAGVTAQAAPAPSSVTLAPFVMVLEPGARVYIMKGTYKGLCGVAGRLTAEQVCVTLGDGREVRVKQTSVRVQQEAVDGAVAAASSSCMPKPSLTLQGCFGADPDSSDDAQDWQNISDSHKDDGFCQDSPRQRVQFQPQAGGPDASDPSQPEIKHAGGISFSAASLGSPGAEEVKIEILIQSGKKKAHEEPSLNGPPPTGSDSG